MDGGDRYIGRVLDNRYEIMELIGAGGMALVYKARCHRLNRMVAVKILKEDLAGDEEFRRRFHTESQAVAMLSHPNIVAVYDVSRSGNTEYIVMELIEGITLKQYINRKGLLSWKEAMHFATQVTKALSHAHSRGIIHRDIKPHNIMILKDGSVKVADFGIARLLSMQNTLTQEALGSVHYISPEQAKGGHVDARSDIYSVGVVMYEMLTSRLPFVGESAVSVAIQHISAIPLMPRDINPDIPVGLEDITMHAMQPDLNMRFTTAEEMLNDLEDFRKNPSIVFKYALDDPRDRQADNTGESQETRVLAPTALVKTGRPPAPKPPRRRPAPTKMGMTRDEYREVSKRATSTSTLVGVFFIVVFLIVIIVFMWNYLLKDIFNPQAREQIEIPNFLNRIYDHVVADELYKESFAFKPPRFEYSDELAAGLIIWQSPAAGSMVDAPLAGNKRNIDLTVSLGNVPPEVMPNLLSMHINLAINELKSMGLNLEIIDELAKSDEVVGYVIETIPKAGEELERGFRVYIRYSGGPEIKEREVPIGSTREQIIAMFASCDIKPNFIYYDDESPEGTVLFIERAGMLVTVPITLDVYISRGPPQPPEETEPPEIPEETESPEETEPPEIPEETEPPVSPTDPVETGLPPDPGDTPPPDQGETPTPDNPGDGGGGDAPPIT